MSGDCDILDRNNIKGEITLTTKAQKWGNSIGVRIPFRIAEKYGIVNGSIIEIEEREDGILFKPMEKDLSLEELLAQVTDENRHEEYFSKPLGRELL